MLIDMFITLINLVIAGIGGVGQVIIELLPDSPFQGLIFDISATYLGYLNWIIPVGTLLGILTASLVAVGVYYIYQTILRWIKAIE